MLGATNPCADKADCWTLYNVGNLQAQIFAKESGGGIALDGNQDMKILILFVFGKFCLNKKMQSGTE